MEAQPYLKSSKPEWLNIRDAVARFGISRAELYNLIKAGAIRSVSLAKEGKKRGKRLISYDSLAAYIESFVDEPAEA